MTEFGTCPNCGMTDGGWDLHWPVTFKCMDCGFRCSEKDYRNFQETGKFEGHRLDGGDLINR